MAELGLIAPRTSSSQNQSSQPAERQPLASPAKHAAAHTPEKYGSKWGTFDIDRALAEITNGTSPPPSDKSPPVSSPVSYEADQLLSEVSTTREQKPKFAPVRKPVTQPEAPSQADKAREEGNALFKQKKFAAAAEAYTR